MLIISLGTSNSTNDRKSITTGDGEEDDSDKVEEIEKNLSKVNSSESRFFTPKASIVFTEASIF